jgi:hypothetical protein
MIAASAYLPSTNSSTIAASSIHGTGAQNFSIAIRSGWTDVSGIAFEPSACRLLEVEDLAATMESASCARKRQRDLPNEIDMPHRCRCGTSWKAHQFRARKDLTHADHQTSMRPVSTERAVNSLGEQTKMTEKGFCSYGVRNTARQTCLQARGGVAHSGSPASRRPFSITAFASGTHRIRASQSLIRNAGSTARSPLQELRASPILPDNARAAIKMR